MAKTADKTTLNPHPLYAAWKATWQMLLDVYEGSGGFLDEQRPYLVPHPREWLDHSVTSTAEDGTAIGTVPNPNPSKPSPKLTMRRKLARYENMAAAILDAVISALFATPPTRQVGDGPSKTPSKIEEWWKNADGLGTSIDVTLLQSWIPAAALGHTILYMEKDGAEPTTAADMQLPRLCRYTPLDVIDWLTDEYGQLTAVKLLEPSPRNTFDKPMASQPRVRVVTQTDWKLYDEKGKLIESAEHGFGRLPIVVLYGKRRALTPLIGKSILGDPMLYIDFYNLVSEVRELLRNQTFAILNVPIGKEGSVETEQARLGSQSGTSNVMFSGEAASFISPDGGNVQAYHDAMDRLGRMCYRLASVPWEGDSRVAESAESRLVKRAELEAVLARYATELSTADAELTELFYRAQHGADGWQKALEQDKVTTKYPETFAPPDLTTLVTDMGLAIGLDLGPTATKEVKKQTVRVILSETPPETMATIDQEIDAQKILTEDEKRKQMLEDAATRMAGRFPQAPAA